VTEWGNPTDGIVFKIVERVPRAACVLHKGPYSALRAAYSAVFSAGSTITGSSRRATRASRTSTDLNKPSEED
jgi:hypothetical protein